MQVDAEAVVCESSAETRVSKALPIVWKSVVVVVRREGRIGRRLGALNKLSLDGLRIVQRLEQVFPVGKGLDAVKRAGIEEREPPLDVVGQRGQ